MKKILTIMLAAILLSACGGQAEPTLSAADVQGTAMAVAWTMIAMTQEAIPTATPIPPTNTPEPTPIPTDTPVPLPTLPPQPLPTSTSASTDLCAGALPPDSPGSTTKLLVVNQSKAQVNLSLSLSMTPHGVCGWTSYQIGKNESVALTVLQGCYFGYAWINDPQSPTTSQGSFCMNNTDKWTLEIRRDFLKMIPP